jgi:multidrug efflux pump subunit AcrA (membrane-fusion protein)
MIEWLKTIIGESYTDALNAQVSKEIPKHFVAKVDFDKKSELLKDAQDEITSLKTQIGERDTQITELSKLDAEGLKTRIAELETANATQAAERKAEAENHQKELAKRDFDSLLDGVLSASKARDTKSVKAHLDLGKLMESKNQTEDIKAAIEEIKKDHDFLFETNEPHKKPTKRTKTGGGDDGDKMTLEEAMIYANENPDVNIDDLI